MVSAHQGYVGSADPTYAVRVRLRRARGQVATLLVAAALTLTGQAPAVWATEAGGVEVTGEPKPENKYREFLWTVRNKGASPIIGLRVPAYLYGGLIMPPPGWSAERIAGGIGDQDILDLVEFHATAPSAWIRPGELLVFEARIHADVRWRPAPRTVAVQLASGEELIVTGVMCPQPEPFVRRNFPLLGLGVIFVVYLLVSVIRRDRRKTKEAHPAA